MGVQRLQWGEGRQDFEVEEANGESAKAEDTVDEG